MPQHSTTGSGVPSPGATYKAARHEAGVIDRRDRGRIVVSGADRASYLQGLLTNDIARLKAGEGCYAAYLTAQGRMISDLWVFELGDVMLLTLPGAAKDTVLAKLDQFIFSEDVQLGDVTSTFADVVVVGPAASRVVSAVVQGAAEDRLSRLGEGGNLRVRFAGEPAIVLAVTDAGVPGLEVLVAATHAGVLDRALRDAGAVEVDPDTAEVLRVEGGVPRFPVDMDEETIPLEAGIESRAISLTKGCYVGQEVIIRVLHRGHGRVVKKLVGLTLEGPDVPAKGTSIQMDGRSVGEIRSAVRSPSLGVPVALGYVHRDFVAPGTRLLVGETPAVVTELPFVS